MDDRKNPVIEGKSFLAKESVSGAFSEEIRMLDVFSSKMKSLAAVNSKMEKLNAVSKADPSRDVIWLLNGHLSSAGVSDAHGAKAYFTRRNSDIVLVTNNVVDGRDRMNSDEAVSALLVSLEPLVDRLADTLRKDPETVSAEKFQSVKRKYATLARWQAMSMGDIERSYKENTTLLSTVLDIGHGSIAKNYEKSFLSVSNSAKNTHFELLKEIHSGKYDPEQVKELEKIRKLMIPLTQKTFDKIWVGDAFADTHVAKFGEFFWENLKDGTVRDQIFAAIEGEWKGVYDATVGIFEIVFKLSTDEKVRESMGKSIKKLWEYVKANCDDPKTVWKDVSKAFATEMEKIKGYPPEKQAYLIGQIAGNVMGTLLLWGAATSVKNGAALRTRYVEGANVVDKAVELRKVSNWDQLEKYVTDIRRIRGVPELNGQKLEFMVRDVRNGTIPVSELPKAWGIREKASELLKHGGFIPEPEGILNKAGNFVGEMGTKWFAHGVRGTGEAVDAFIRTADFLSGKTGLRTLAEIVETKGMAAASHVAESVGTAVRNLAVVEKSLEMAKDALVKAWGAYQAAKEGISAIPSEQLQKIAHRTLGHVEETAYTLQREITRLKYVLPGEKTALGKVEAVLNSTIGNLKYLAKRSLKDPLFAEITSWGSFEPIIQNVTALSGKVSEISSALGKTVWEAVQKANVGVLDAATWKAEARVVGNWADSLSKRLINGKQVLRYEGGMAKTVELTGIKNADGTLVAKDLHGFKDLSWKQVIECKYESATDFKNGFATVESGGKLGLVDRFGKEFFPEKPGMRMVSYEPLPSGKVLVEAEVLGKGEPMTVRGLFDPKLGAFITDPAPGMRKFMGGYLLSDGTGGWNVVFKNGELLGTKSISKPINVGSGFAIETEWGWRVVTGKGRMLDDVFMEKPQKHGNGTIAKSKEGWHILDEGLSASGEVLPTKPESYGLGFCVRTDGKWRAYTYGGKRVPGEFITKPEMPGTGNAIAKDAKGWRIIDESGEVYETVFSEQPLDKVRKWGIGKVGEDWRISDVFGKNVDVAFVAKPETTFVGVVWETKDGWRIVLHNGKIEGPFRSKPKIVSTFFAAWETPEWWRIVAANGKWPSRAFSNAPEECGWGMKVKEGDTWTVMSEDGRLITDIPGAPFGISKKVWAYEAEGGIRLVMSDGRKISKVFEREFTIPGLDGITAVKSKEWWHMFTEGGKMVDVPSLEQPIGVNGTSLIKDAKGWAIVDESGKVAPGRYEKKTVSMPQWPDMLVLQDAKGMRPLLLGGKLAKEPVSEILGVGHDSYLWMTSRGWKFFERGWAAWSEVIQGVPETFHAGTNGFRVPLSEGGFRYYNDRWAMIPGIYRSMKVSGSNVQLESLAGETITMSETSFRTRTAWMAAQNEDAILAAGFVLENHGAIRDWGKNVRRDLKIMDTAFIWETSKNVIVDLRTATLEDFMVGLRLENRELNASFKNFSSSLPKLSDGAKLDVAIEKTVSQNIDIYIRNVNDRRKMLNAQNSSGDPIPPLSEFETAHLKGEFKLRMAAEFSKALKNDLAQPGVRAGDSKLGAMLSEITKRAKMDAKFIRNHENVWKSSNAYH